MAVKDKVEQHQTKFCFDFYTLFVVISIIMIQNWIQVNLLTSFAFNVLTKIYPFSFESIH